MQISMTTKSFLIFAQQFWLLDNNYKIKTNFKNYNLLVLF